MGMLYSRQCLSHLSNCFTIHIIYIISALFIILIHTSHKTIAHFVVVYKTIYKTVYPPQAQPVVKFKSACNYSILCHLRAVARIP